MSYTKLTEATIKTPNSETGLIADKDGILLNTVKTNIESWASAVIGNGAYRFSNQEILHNVEILEAIVSSISSGKEVNIIVYNLV